MKDSTQIRAFSHFRHAEEALATSGFSLNHRDERRGSRDEYKIARPSSRAPCPSQGFSLVELTSLSLANLMSLGKLSPRRRPGSSRKLLWIPACTGMTNGFSLVELSIVLVILGLLTGGILTGQNLIRNAELRSVVTEFQAYQTAVNTFRDKYFSYPGDMSNAEDFWGSMSTGTCPNATAGVGTETCNGNGNGILEMAWANGQVSEEFAAWQHLANAGLIGGSYTGVSGPSSQIHSIIGENIPQGKTGNTGWSFIYVGTITDPLEPDWFLGEYGQLLQIGAQNGFHRTGGSAFTPEEVWNIDMKIDDGKPGYGKIKTLKFSSRPCATTDDHTTAEYNLTNSDITCNIRFTVWK